MTATSPTAAPGMPVLDPWLDPRLDPRLDQDTVIAIICAAERGKSETAISRRYAVPEDQVSHILGNRRRPPAAARGSE